MAEWGCGEYTECPCGCGWSVCGIYGGWVEDDCEECGDLDPVETYEEETDDEED